MRAAADVVNRMLKRNGIVNRELRIQNIDKGINLLGYVEVNTQASTPFSRTIVHKGWFSGNANIQNGDLVLDRADGRHYLVMSVKPEFSGGRNAYIDGTLYLAEVVCTIERFDGTTKNAFGRTTSAPEVIATDVHAMINPLTIDSVEYEEREADKSKVKLVVQAKWGVKQHDRITTSLGKKFVVSTIDDASLAGLLVLKVDLDNR